MRKGKQEEPRTSTDPRAGREETNQAPERDPPSRKKKKRILVPARALPSSEERIKRRVLHLSRDEKERKRRRKYIDRIDARGVVKSQKKTSHLERKKRRYERGAAKLYRWPERDRPKEHGRK